jgi:hypothetical protein
MTTICATLLWCVLLLTVAVHASAQQRRPPLSPDEWKTYARQLAIGSTVKVTPAAGEPFIAILFVVDDSGIVVKPKTRVPEAARRVAFDALVDLEVRKPGVSIAKHAGIGALVGGIFFVWVLASGTL